MGRNRRVPPQGLIYIEDSPAGPGIASRLGVRPNTVRAWRSAGRGPRTWVVNGRVASTVADCCAYLASLERQSERAA